MHAQIKPIQVQQHVCEIEVAHFVGPITYNLGGLLIKMDTHEINQWLKIFPEKHFKGKLLAPLIGGLS